MSVDGRERQCYLEFMYSDFSCPGRFTLALNVSVCLSVCLPACLSAYLYVCMSVCLSVWLSLSLSLIFSISLSFSLSFSLTFSLSSSLSLSLSLFFLSLSLLMKPLWSRAEEKSQELFFLLLPTPGSSSVMKTHSIYATLQTSIGAVT